MAGNTTGFVGAGKYSADASAAANTVSAVNGAYASNTGSFVESATGPPAYRRSTAAKYKSLRGKKRSVHHTRWIAAAVGN
jgi:hypothetical protein